MKKALNVGVVGASGMVGSTILEILAEHKFPINNLFLLGHRSAGEIIDYARKPYMVEELADFDFAKTDLCFFCTSNEVSEKYIPRATAAGNVVIDKSSFYRYDPEVPLIVPEVNLNVLEKYRNKKIT